MTNREFYTAIITASVSDEITEYAKSELAKMDARNAKRKETESPKQKENEILKNDILAILANGKKVASELAAELGTSTQKISSLCTQLLASGKIVAGERKEKGKRAVKEFTLPSAQ